MADLKENEFASKNDFAYVRALDAADNSIRISKADLVKVLEGLMGIKGMFSNNLDLLPGKEIDTRYRMGLILLRDGNTGNAACYLFHSYTNNANKELASSAAYSTIEDDPDKVCVYKKKSSGYITIKNNTQSTAYIGYNIIPIY